MKSNYEREAFRIKFIVFTILFLLVILVWSYVVFEADWHKMAVTLVICLLYSFVVYILAYHMLNHA